MNEENDKYRMVIDLLKNSKPKLHSTEEIEEEVFKRIARKNRVSVFLGEFFDFIFSWIYIGWVRRALITASVALVFVFVYQQRVILHRIDFLSRQTVVTSMENITGQSGQVEKMLLNFRSGLRRLSSTSITISEKQMLEIIETLNELQSKNKDLEKLLSDPEIKKIIEKKLIENNRSKL